MDARKFFFVCAGIVCLAVAYHLGATNTVAQSAGVSFVAMAPSNGNTLRMFALSPSGDVWTINSNATGPGDLNAVFVGSIFGGPVAIEGQSFGATKAKYH